MTNQERIDNLRKVIQGDIQTALKWIDESDFIMVMRFVDQIANRSINMATLSHAERIAILGLATIGFDTVLIEYLKRNPELTDEPTTGA